MQGCSGACQKEIIGLSMSLVNKEATVERHGLRVLVFSIETIARTSVLHNRTVLSKEAEEFSRILYGEAARKFAFILRKATLYLFGSLTVPQACRHIQPMILWAKQLRKRRELTWALQSDADWKEYGTSLEEEQELRISGRGKKLLFYGLKHSTCVVVMVQADLACLKSKFRDFTKRRLKVDPISLLHVQAQCLESHAMAERPNLDEIRERKAICGSATRFRGNGGLLPYVVLVRFLGGAAKKYCRYQLRKFEYSLSPIQGCSAFSNALDGKRSPYETKELRFTRKLQVDSGNQRVLFALLLDVIVVQTHSRSKHHDNRGVHHFIKRAG
ncbi:hypothetical protein Tco_0659807 [Tanacetum coccineum]